MKSCFRHIKGWYLLRCLTSQERFHVRGLRCPRTLNRTGPEPRNGVGLAIYPMCWGTTWLFLTGDGFQHALSFVLTGNRPLPKVSSDFLASSVRDFVSMREYFFFQEKQLICLLYIPMEQYLKISLHTPSSIRLSTYRISLGIQDPALHWWRGKTLVWLIWESSLPSTRANLHVFTTETLINPLQTGLSLLWILSHKCEVLMFLTQTCWDWCKG